MGYQNHYNENVTINISSSLKNNYLNLKPLEQKDSGRNHYNEEEEFKLMSHKRRPFPKACVGLGAIIGSVTFKRYKIDCTFSGYPTVLRKEICSGRENHLDLLKAQPGTLQRPPTGKGYRYDSLVEIIYQ